MISAMSSSWTLRCFRYAPKRRVQSTKNNIVRKTTCALATWLPLDDDAACDDALLLEFFTDVLVLGCCTTALFPELELLFWLFSRFSSLAGEPLWLNARASGAIVLGSRCAFVLAGSCFFWFFCGAARAATLPFERMRVATLSPSRCSMRLVCACCAGCRKLRASFCA